MRVFLLFLAFIAAGAAGPLPASTGLTHYHQHGNRYLLRRDDKNSDSSHKTDSTEDHTSTHNAKDTESSKSEEKDESTETSDSAKSTDDAKSTSKSSDKPKSSNMPTSSSESSQKSTKDSSQLSSVTEMPSVNTEMPSISTTSSSTSYSYAVTVPPLSDHNKNPYIQYSRAPNNVVFIVVGAILGALILAFVAARTTMWCLSRRKAQVDKEVYFLNGSHIFSWGGSGASFPNSSQSSLMEKSLFSSHMLLKYPSSNTLNWDTSTQGRLYREMLTPLDRRGSMTISPVLEMMQGLRSQVDLTLLHPSLDSAAYHNELPPASFPESGLSNKSKRLERPPSQVLDDLLSGIDLSKDPGNL